MNTAEPESVITFDPPLTTEQAARFRERYMAGAAIDALREALPEGTCFELAPLALDGWWEVSVDGVDHQAPSIADAADAAREALTA